ncbi:MAG: FtsX-like permease family protein [Fibrella sp.]|nr:FtsX-like permease family protein [Armatimonadota bacterium]
MTITAALTKRRVFANVSPAMPLALLMVAFALTVLAPASRAAVDPVLAAKYREIAATVDAAAMSKTVRELSSHGSRVVGYPGERFAADYVEREFVSLFGKDNVRTESFTATVPMDKGASLSVNGKTIPLAAIWPNLIRTSQTPPEGISGPLIYGGDGSLGSLNGKTVKDSIVLVDFNSGAEWMNAPRLGAKAIIFIEPDRTQRGEAEAKFISIPISIPRYYVKRGDAAGLLALAAGNRGTQATLKATMPWENVQARNFIGVLPGKSKNPKVAKQIIVVQAYYDGMSVVPSLAPSADSASSMAGLLQAARTFKKLGSERTIWFVATSGHFLGLQGVREMVDKHIDDWQVPGPFAKLFGGEKEPNEPIYLWAGLDWASQTRGVGIFYKGWFYNVREDTQNLFSDIARVARENNDKVAQVFGNDPKKAFADGVNPVDGKSWRNFIPGKPAFDSEAVGMAGGHGVTFASIDDSRNLVDTPFDTAEKVNIANLAFQARTFLCLFQHYVNDPNDPNSPEPTKQIPLFKPSQWTRMGLRSGFASIRGRVREYNPRKSLVPDDPIADSLAVYPSQTVGDAPSVPGTKSFLGVRGFWVQRVGMNDWTEKRAALDKADAERRAAKAGNDPARIAQAEAVFEKADSAEQKARNGAALFNFKGVPPKTADGGKHSVAAYRLDPVSGDIDYAPDRGVSGKDFPTEFEITSGLKETTVVIFPCVATTIFDLVDQQALRTLSTITIFDGASNGEPRQFGYALPKPEAGISYVEDVALIFARRGNEFGDSVLTAGATPSKGQAGDSLRKFKIIMGSGPAATRFLLINSTPANPEGEGYVMGAGEGAEAINSSKSAAIINTSLAVAKDMWSIDEYRIERLRKNNIVNQGVVKLHADAATYIKKADDALAAKNYEAFDAYSRAAWGYESRAYPNVTKTQQDVVNGVIFYLALMIPFAYFGERLFFSFPDLKRQLLGIAGIFLGVFLVFAAIHPAFNIALNPGIILLSFIMLALSLLVTSLVWGKFEQQLKDSARASTGTHDKDAGSGSIAAAAFSLGISNMRRRKARTALTCATLVLLTFTVLAFTSIVEDLRFNQVPAPGNPAYNGILMRDPNWNSLQQVAYRLLDDEFGKTRLVAPRGWFLGTQPGEQTFLTIKRADKEFGAKGAVGLSPEEAQITGADKALAVGRWFAPGDRLAMILPRKIADSLRITDKDVGSAQVAFSGQNYTIIGILDQEKFKTVQDLDQEPLTPVDFVQMSQLQQQGKANNSTGFQQYLHLDPDVVFFIPYGTLVNLGGDLRSIGIGYKADDKGVLDDLRNNLMKRFDMNLYAASGGKINRFSSIGANSSKGFETIIIPIMIAALIVLNTMLGSVFERVKEIHVFSSIGLNATNIGTLFMAEAFVYAILGSVAGYVVGQLVSKFLTMAGLMQGLQLNFSSISAVLSTLIVVAVVLLSTIWPANKAAEVATPASGKTWVLPEPEGDEWRIKLPFAVTGNQAWGINGFLAEWFRSYEGYSVGDFITENITRETLDSEYGTAYRVACKAWLAPFDLGVSQFIKLETVPTDFEDVYDLKLTLTRVSGDISNWKRVNRRFLNTLRKQFLIWRTLSESERERYLNEAVAEAKPADESQLPVNEKSPASSASGNKEV